jgi:hypothetical protein
MSPRLIMFSLLIAYGPVSIYAAEGETCPPRSATGRNVPAAETDDRLALRVPVDLTGRRPGAVSRLESLTIRFDPADRLEALTHIGIVVCSERDTVLTSVNIRLTRGQVAKLPKDATGGTLFRLDAKTIKKLKRYSDKADAIVFYARLSNGKYIKPTLGGAENKRAAIVPPRARTST